MSKNYGSLGDMMVKIVFVLGLLITTSKVYATGGFECVSESGKTRVTGIIGAGATLLDNIYVNHREVPEPIVLKATMKWVDYSMSEIKIASYNAVADQRRLLLKVENGNGFLSIDLSDMKGGNDIVLQNLKVNCELE